MAQLLERDAAKWQCVAQISEFTADAERDTFHELYPHRARLLDRAHRRGVAVPKLFVPHISADDMRRCGFDPNNVREYHGNLLTTAGLTRLMLLLINSGATQAYDSTHTAIGVGDGNNTVPSPAIGDTDLTAHGTSGNIYYKTADGGFPSVALGVMTVQSTFPTTQGNWTNGWNEWGIFGNTADGSTAGTAPMLNHKGVSMGTKTSASAWAFKVTVTIA